MNKENIKFFASKLESLAIYKEFYSELANTKGYLSEEKIQKLYRYYCDATKFVMNFVGLDMLPYVQTILLEDIEKSKHKKFVTHVYEKLNNEITEYLSQEKNNLEK